MNEKPSVRIESARSKTSNNGPLRNGSAVSIARLYVSSKIVCFYESDNPFKTIWRRPCSFHLIKRKACFLKPDRPVFIIVINTSCSGVCYRIYARQRFFNNALAPDGALALFGIFAGRISCNKRPHTQYLLLQQRSKDVLPPWSMNKSGTGCGQDKNFPEITKVLNVKISLKVQL